MDDQQTQDLYIAFRSDPLNDRFDDSVFCSENECSLDRLKRIKTPDVIKKIFNKQPTDIELLNLLGQLTRLCYEKALTREIPVKSFEGLVNAITNLLKQRNLATGQPTEILKYEELKKKSPAELHEFIMGTLRSGRN